MPISKNHPYAADYVDTREVFDPGEACWLLTCGWTVLEAITLTRWAQGYHSESTSYVLGLPRNAGRDVAAISEALAG